MPQEEGSWVQTMPEYGGTLPKLIASHIGLLKCPRKKEGVWEDTRMLKSVSGDCAGQAGLEAVNLA